MLGCQAALCSLAASFTGAPAARYNSGGRRVLPVASALVSDRVADATAVDLQRVQSYDYSCIAHGQPFVAQNWLSDDLLQALRADARGLLADGAFFDENESLGKRLKLSLYEADWTAPSESPGVPSEARAAARKVFDALLLELESVLHRRLTLDEHGAQAKYAIAKQGEPLAYHVDQRHEALGGSHAVHHGEKTRRSLGWLLYLSDDGWDEPGGSGSGGTLCTYPRYDAVGRCGVHDESGDLQVGWIERGQGSEPVFLDGWVLPAWMEGGTLEDYAHWRGGGGGGGFESEEAFWSAMKQVQPAYQLYCDGADGRRENLSEVHERPTGSERVPSLREMLHPHVRDGWSSTIARGHEKQRLVEVSPRGGTLVIFDAVTVPHEVTAVVSGERLALFGFIAGERPVSPAWRLPPGPDGGPVNLPPAWRSNTEREWFHQGWARDFHHHFQYTKRGRYGSNS